MIQTRFLLANIRLTECSFICCSVVSDGPLLPTPLEACCSSGPLLMRPGPAVSISASERRCRQVVTRPCSRKETDARICTCAGLRSLPLYWSLQTSQLLVVSGTTSGDRRGLPISIRRAQEKMKFPLRVDTAVSSSKGVLHTKGSCALALLFRLVSSSFDDRMTC